MATRPSLKYTGNLILAQTVWLYYFDPCSTVQALVDFSGISSRTILRYVAMVNSKNKNCPIYGIDWKWEPANFIAPKWPTLCNEAFDDKTQPSLPLNTVSLLFGNGQRIPEDLARHMRGFIMVKHKDLPKMDTNLRLELHAQLFRMKQHFMNITDGYWNSQKSIDSFQLKDEDANDFSCALWGTYFDETDETTSNSPLNISPDDWSVPPLENYEVYEDSSLCLHVG